MSFQERIATKEPIIFDGAMATSLYDKGFYINRSFEELSVTEAQAVREVTQGFKKAGAQVLRTNTFGAVWPKLKEYGLQDKLSEIIEAAAKITCEVAGGDASALASIGPLGVVVEPLGPTSIDEATTYYEKNVLAFEKTEIEGYSLDGFHDLKELGAAIAAVRLHSKKPIVASIGIQENLRTSFGHSLKEFVTFCDKYDVEVLGLCGDVGPSGMLSAIETLRPLTERPIVLLPNAGLPRYVNDQYIYLCNPDYIGKFAKRFIQAGANMVGGHCGVKDEHIKAINNAIKMASSMTGKTQAWSSVIQDIVDEPREIIPLEKRSRLGAALHAKEKVISVEIIPPSGVDCRNFFSHCQALQDGGVQFVNIPDGARAMSRVSSLQLSSYVANHFNLEPIPHFTTRDRNLIGLQSDMLGAHINGVRNILVVTGDPPKLGNCPGATAVYDVDAIGLTHIVSRMKQGLDMGGSSFGNPAEFVVGVALNPTARNRELEIQRFKYKIEAGADYAITQPIYDMDDYKSFFDELGPVDIPVVIGIWPLVSLRNAEFLKNEVPGVSVPDWVIDEMKKAGDSKEESIKRGVEIAIKTMELATNLVAGFQVSAPFNKVSVALKVINAVKEM